MSLNFKEKLQKFRIFGLAFTAFEVIMHAYLFVLLITVEISGGNISADVLKTSAIAFTLFEVIMNTYLFIFLLLHKEKRKKNLEESEEFLEE